MGKIYKPSEGRPFVIGLFYGFSKPSSHDFLHDFAVNVPNLKTMVNETVLRFSVYEVFCVAPAGATLKTIKGHNSYSGHKRCSQVGV